MNDRNIFKLVVGKQADGTKITINSKGGDITVVGNGDIARINVKGKSDVTVRGKSDRAPKIVNNAEGASISTAMNASVSLNKPAELIVKAGAKIISLNVKAASDISVAAGATVDAVKVSADKVNLKVDGTVAKVAVNSKADVAISGSTKNTIEVTNNAAGSNVQTSVKTDLKLNADAKISLDKGAEGSSVKVEKEGVKPSVENKTSADVTIKDAKGTDSTIAAEKTDADEKPSSEDKGAEESSVKEEKEGEKPSSEDKGDGSSSGDSSGSGTGGSSIPSTPSTPSVTKPALKLESDVTGRSYLKANDTLTAKVTGVGDAQVTYRWKKNGALISGAIGEKYTIGSADEGSHISATVVVTPKNGEGYSLDSGETDYIWKAVRVRSGYNITVSYKTEAMILKNSLNSNYNKISLGTVVEGELMSDTVTWDVTDAYNGAVAGDYTVNGTAVAPNGYYFAEEADAKVICKVTVKPEGALRVTGKLATTDVCVSSECAANQKIFKVSMKNQTIVISGVYAKAEKQNEDVPLMLELYADGAENLQWSKDGATSWMDIKKSGQIGIELYLNEYLGTPKAIYVRDGSDGVVTPVYIQIDAQNLDLFSKEKKPYETELDAKTFPDVGTMEDLKLPTKIALVSRDGDEYEISVTWACDKVYGKEGAGTYTFYPTLGEKPAFTAVYIGRPDPIHIELKMVEKPSA